MGSRRRSAETRDDGWTTEVASGVALAGFLFLVLVGFTLLAMGPLISLDAYFNLAPPPPAWLTVLHVLDRIGQRAVCLPVLAVATWLCCRRRESWRPAWVAAALGVRAQPARARPQGACSVGASPTAADPNFFVGGMAYPSGHTANIVLVYGLTAYLLGRYRGVGRTAVRLMWSAVALLSLTMVVTSLTLNWHWFADLVAGLLVGGLVLQLTVAIDAAVPQTALDGGPRQVLRSLRRRLDPPTPVVPPVLPHQDAP